MYYNIGAAIQVGNNTKYRIFAACEPDCGYFVYNCADNINFCDLKFVKEIKLREMELQWAERNRIGITSNVNTIYNYYPVNNTTGTSNRSHEYYGDSPASRFYSNYITQFNTPQD